MVIALVDVVVVAGSDLRKLNAEDPSFFGSDNGVPGKEVFCSDSAGFENEKNGFEAVADVAVGVLGAPNENPPEGFDASVLGVVDDVVVPAPKEKPPVVVVAVGVVAEVAFPNAKDDEDVTAGGAMDDGGVAAGIVPNPVPVPNAGLFNKEFWFNPLTSETVRRNGDWRAGELDAVPKAEAGGCVLPNENCEVGPVAFGAVMPAGLSNGEADDAGALAFPNENPVFCAAGGCPNAPAVGVVGCAPKGLGCEAAPNTDVLGAAFAPNPSGDGFAGCAPKVNVDWLVGVVGCGTAGAAPKADVGFPNAGAEVFALAPKLNDGVLVGAAGGAKLNPPGV